MSQWTLVQWTSGSRHKLSLMRSEKGEGGGGRGWRLVIYLSKLNEFLTPVTFQLDTLAKVKSVAEQDMFAYRLIRRAPPRSDARGPTRIPLFSSQRQEIHVPGSSLRSYDGTIGIHASGEANKDLVVEIPPNPIPIPRRLVKSVQLSGWCEGIDVAFYETMREIRIAGKSRKVRAPAYTVNRVPRREARLGTGSRFPNRGTPTSDGPSPLNM